MAWIGLVGSLLVVLVFPTATWWNGTFSGQKFAIAFLAPIVFVIGWAARKLWASHMHEERRTQEWKRRWGWVTISNNPNRLMETLDDLKCAIPEYQERSVDDLLEQHPWLAPLMWPFRQLRHIFHRRTNDGTNVTVVTAVNGSATRSTYNGAPTWSGGQNIEM
jgi:hypothetical protein